MKVKSESEVAQSCPTLCDPMDCSLPGSSVHGIFLKFWSLGTLRSCCWLTRFLVRLFFWLDDGYLLLESLYGRERADASPIMSLLWDPMASVVAALGLVAPWHVESSAVILARPEESSGGPTWPLTPFPPGLESRTLALSAQPPAHGFQTCPAGSGCLQRLPSSDLGASGELGAKRHSAWEPVMETWGQSWEKWDSTAWPHVTLAWPKAATPCPGSPAVAKMEPLRPGTWFFWTVSLPTRLNPPSSGCTFPCLLVVPAVRPRTSYPQPRAGQDGQN